MRILLILTVFALFGTGCVERRMTITSEPTGADVYVNNTWHGKTPMIFPFKHYGTYSIRLEAPDYEPLDAKEPIQAPFHQRAYVDFVTDVIVPRTIKDERPLHYVLAPKSESFDSPDEVIGRFEQFSASTHDIINERKDREATRVPKELPLPEKNPKKETPKTSQDTFKQTPETFGDIDLPKY